MFKEQELDIKIKYEFLLNELHDMAGLTNNLSGNLECILYIMKKYFNHSSKKFKTIKTNFQILGEISQQLESILTKAEKISFDYIKNPINKKNKLKKKKDNLIIFPLIQDVEAYVYSEKTINFKEDE